MVEDRIIIGAGDRNINNAAVVNLVGDDGVRPQSCNKLRDYVRPDTSQIGPSII